MGSARLTVSISQEMYSKLEEIKKRKNLDRSKLVQKIIREYFEMEEEKDLIRSYIYGYKRKPENEEDIAGLEKTQFSILDKEF